MSVDGRRIADKLDKLACEIKRAGVRTTASGQDYPARPLTSGTTLVQPLQAFY